MVEEVPSAPTSTGANEGATRNETLASVLSTSFTDLLDYYERDLRFLQRLTHLRKTQRDLRFALRYRPIEAGDAW